MTLAGLKSKVTLSRHIPDCHTDWTHLPISHFSPGDSQSQKKEVKIRTEENYLRTEHEMDLVNCGEYQLIVACPGVCCRLSE